MLPFLDKKLIIHTLLNLDQAVEALSQEVQPSRSFWPKPFSEKHYVGTIGREGFRIKRNSQLWRSGVPGIAGQFETSNGATNVEIRIIVNRLALISVVGGLAVFFAVFLLIISSSEPVSQLWLILGTLGAAIIGYMFCILHFAIDMYLEKKYLLGLFLSRDREARIVPPDSDLPLRT
jgi:hypothetical protein